MDGGASAGYFRDMHTLFDAGTASGLSDRQLLERFAGGRDGSSDSAFEVLVQRHGPMVMRVCRSTLGQEQADAHDAFQATFLVLVRKSKSIRRLDSVGSWLFGVASRVARRARVEAARRRAAERQGGLRLAATAEHGADAAERQDLGELLQAEVDRLPDHLRAVMVLCYWEGLTHEQAAARLGCPLGTVRSRIARARTLLHRRLSRRGLEPVAGVTLAALDSPAFLKATALEIPATLVSSTVGLAKPVASGGSLAQLTSPSIAALVQNVIGSMFMTKLKTISVCLLLLSAGAYGLTLAATQVEGTRARRDRAQPPARAKSKAQPPLKLMSEYVVEPPDLLLVEVLEALPGRPISGERLVRPDGTVSLGWYGDVHAAGLTVSQVKEKIILHLRKFIKDEELGLIKYDDVTAEPVIDPKTNECVRIDPRDSDRVFVDVTAYNSKYYYMQGELNAPGRLPVTGADRVLDAINYASGLTTEADHDQVFLYRQPPDGAPVQTLKIDIDQIMLGDDLSTNYQLLPGDRLVVRRRGEQPRTTQVPAPRPSKPASKPAAEPAFFDRSPDTREKASGAETGKQPGNTRNPSIQRLEQRMSEMERKLDLILESIKSPAR
jgi:polysaccharide export outer membrane protein